MSDSKTGRKAAAAAAAMNQASKKVITDEQYIKNLRYDLENGLYVAQEGARALLRQYDLLLGVLEGKNLTIQELTKVIEATVTLTLLDAAPGQ